MSAEQSLELDYQLERANITRVDELLLQMSWVRARVAAGLPRQASPRWYRPQFCRRRRRPSRSPPPPTELMNRLRLLCCLHPVFSPGGTVGGSGGAAGSAWQLACGSSPVATLRSYVAKLPLAGVRGGGGGASAGVACPRQRSRRR